MLETLVCFIRNKKQESLINKNLSHDRNQNKIQDLPEYKLEAKEKFCEEILITGEMEQGIFESGIYEVETLNRKRLEDKKNYERKQQTKSVPFNLKINRNAVHPTSLITMGAKQNNFASSNHPITEDCPNMNCKSILSF